MRAEPRGISFYVSKRIVREDGQHLVVGRRLSVFGQQDGAVALSGAAGTACGKQDSQPAQPMHRSLAGIRLTVPHISFYLANRLVQEDGQDCHWSSVVGLRSSASMVAPAGPACGKQDSQPAQPMHRSLAGIRLTVPHISFYLANRLVQEDGQGCHWSSVVGLRSSAGNGARRKARGQPAKGRRLDRSLVPPCGIFGQQRPAARYSTFAHVALAADRIGLGACGLELGAFDWVVKEPCGACSPGGVARPPSVRHPPAPSY